MATADTAPLPTDLNAGIPPMNMSNGIINGFTADGRPIQVRPCKYYPNCAKMDDPEHNAMYSHNAVVKRVPKEKRDPSRAPNPQGNQLCGFGDQCKRCGDEDHLDKFIHSCKFGNKCKKMDDPIHLKRFIHVLPPGFPTGPTIPTGRNRGPAGGAFPPSFSPYGMPGGYPNPYSAYYGAMAANPYAAAASAYSAAAAPTGSGYSPPHASHHSRASSGYHPYGRSNANAASLYGAADPLAAASAAYGADRNAAAAASAASAYAAYSNYSNYNDAVHLMQNGGAPDMSQYGM